MSEKRVVVWVQHFADRPYLMLQWHDPVTKARKSRSAETNNPEDAERKRADLEYELNHGTYQEPSRLTWEAFRRLFEEEYAASRRQNTRENFTATFDLFERVCHPQGLRTICERTLSVFASGLRREPGRGGNATMAPSTVKVRLAFLRIALRWAADQGLIPKCPKFPKVKVPKKKPQPVATEAFERLTAAAPDAPTRAFLLCCWLAGLRLSEAFALEWEPTGAAPWVDFVRERIWLPAELVKAVEDQWVPLDPALREALLALPRHGKKVFRFVGKGNLISPSALGDRVIRLAKKVGVRLTTRALRRGFGCRYAGKVPAQVLQKLMRHASIKTTMEYYANVDDAVEAAVLGDRRNSSRNSGPSAAAAAGGGPPEVLADEGASG
jgi:integrase